MKKVLKGSLSIICCIAILMSLFTALPLRSLAADTGSAQMHLRIEGSTAEVYSGNVSFTEGESLSEILNDFTKANNITYQAQTGAYGLYVKTIGADTQPDDFSFYWAFYINDISSDKGVSSVFPHEGDAIVLAYVNSSTNYPYITLSKKNPAPNDDVTFHVSTDIEQFDSSWNSLGIKNQPISYAAVIFNGNPYTTDTNGYVLIKMPTSEGTYNLSIQNSISTYPAIIRTGLIPIKVTTTPESNCEFGIKDINRTVDFTVPGTAVTNLDILGGQAGIKLGVTGTDSKSGQTVAPLTVNMRNGYHTFSVLLPTSNITGPSTWDGSISFDFVSTSSLSVAGSTINAAVKIGSTAGDLTLDNYAKITLPDQTGKSTGYFDASNTFHKITVKLLSDSIPADFTESNAYFDNGKDLIIYTKHFSSFVSYTVNSTSNDNSINTIISSSAGYLAAKDSSDWSVLALNRASSPTPAAYLTAVSLMLEQNKGNFSNPTTLSKTIIALRAGGANPESFNSYNLVEKLYNYPLINKTGINGLVFALLALDSGNYNIPQNALWNTSKLIDLILSYQNGSGFALDHSIAADTDITAMTITEPFRIKRTRYHVVFA
jgi:hypothetical protein